MARGRSEDLGPWLRMPYCPGGDLTGRRLPPAAVAGFLERMRGTLEGLHAAGLVHRDLSPGNILFDGEGVPHLADFGCLLRIGELPDIPRDGLGTPAYADPRQLLGGPADPRGDLYALGAICYECLTGGPPFVEAVPERMAVRKLRELPRPLAEIPPGVPAGLARAVEALLRIQ